jgi:hypothetical protein
MVVKKDSRGRVVKDKHGKPVKILATTQFISATDARRGLPLNSIQLTADFGRPYSQVTLTLYRRQALRSHRRSLVTLVRFCPFTVQRAPGVELRFDVPGPSANGPGYDPTHIGVAVQEVKTGHFPVPAGDKCVPANTKVVDFAAFGKLGGTVVPIAYANLLHKRSPGPRHHPKRLATFGHRRG